MNISAISVLENLCPCKRAVVCDTHSPECRMVITLLSCVCDNSVMFLKGMV